MPKPTTLWRLLRAGSFSARSAVVRSWSGASRIAAIKAGLDSGVLLALNRESATVPELADRLDTDRADLLEAFLPVLAAHGLVRRRGDEWRLTKTGHGLCDDPVATALADSFGGYQLGVYTGLAGQLQAPVDGGADRDDFRTEAETIATVSTFLEPVVRDELTKVMSELVPSTVLDVGCGTGRLLVHMLAASKAGRGIGIDSSPEALDLAARTCREAGVGNLVELVTGDAVDVLPEVAQPESVDLALLANVVYYLQEADRRELFEAVSAVLAPGGEVLVITTDVDSSTFSTHFNLLLASQRERVALVPQPKLAAELQAAGLRVRRTKRLSVGEPVIAMLAKKAGQFSA